MIIGQDLAFGESGESHAAGIGTGGIENIQTDKMRKLRDEGITDRNMVVIDGYHGGKVVTRINMRNYLLWFEQNIPLAVAAGFRVINATEGGAKIHGAEQMTLAETTEQFLDEPLDIMAKIDACAQPEQFDAAEFRQRLEHKRADMRELVRKSERARERAGEVQKLMERKPMPVERINKLVHKIDRDEKRIKELIKRYDELLSAVANKTMVLIKTAFDYEGLSREESLRLNMKHSATMFQAMIESGKIIEERFAELSDTLADF